MPMSMEHLWSISVEMQFYVLAPLIFACGGDAVRRRLSVWLLLLVVLMALGLIEPLRAYREKYHFEVAAWPMMLGFLAEYLKSRVRVLPGWLMRAGIGMGAALLALATVLSILDMKRGLVIALGATVFVPCFLCYISQRTAPGPVGTGATWLGQRTYSIYLWQQPLTLCYHVLEVPFLSSRRRRVTEDAVS
jgi:peptidoglycan/LPS O-acetylase OafA/YrhL